MAVDVLVCDGSLLVGVLHWFVCWFVGIGWRFILIAGLSGVAFDFGRWFWEFVVIYCRSVGLIVKRIGRLL